MPTSAHNLLIGTAISLICINMLAVAMIILGAGNLSNCPVAPGIVVYLFGSGITVVFSTFLGVAIQRRINKKYPLTIDRRWPTTALNLVALFINVAWSFPGGYWVFSSMVPDFSDPTSPLYCHKDSFFLSMWTCIITWCVAIFLLYFWVKLDRAIVRNDIKSASQEDDSRYCEDSSCET
ncbi:hypothetical protein ACHWQZ_G015466 [Mnemiopsis leidyi]